MGPPKMELSFLIINDRVTTKLSVIYATLTNTLYNVIVLLVILTNLS